MRREAIIVILMLLLSGSTQAQKLTAKWQPMLDSELSMWEIWMGAPHVSVDLDGVEKAENVHTGVALGLNNDPKKVFSMIEQNGEAVLQITGEIYGGLTTLNDYSNYHFKTYFKWGEKKWAPRLTAIRDNGILYHCQGEHGAFWNVWKSSLEYQVQEDDMGDFINIAGSYADCKAQRSLNENGKPVFSYDPMGEWYTFQWGKQEAGLCAKVGDNEKPNGEWNLLEIIVVGDRAIHIVNGEVVNVVKNAKRDSDGQPTSLTSGQLQIQSEGAECYYKGMEIRRVKKFPKAYLSLF